MNTSSLRKGDWFQTYTGRPFWPLDPRPEDFNIMDIAHGLSNICRFGGHSRVFYSVAQHSVFVSHLAPGMEALLHDATEAYLGDMVRPLKGSMPEYQNLEHKVWAAIATAFGLPLVLPKEVKNADNLALVTERRDIMSPCSMRWSECLERITPHPALIEAWTPARAEVEFLNRYFDLKG